MASNFYNRFIPLPKTYNENLQSGKKSEVIPKVAENDRSGKSPVNIKNSKRSAKRSAPDTHLDYRPKKRLSPERGVQDLSPSVGQSAKLREDGPLVNDTGLTPLTIPATNTEEATIPISSALPKWIQDPVVASDVDRQPFETLPLSETLVSNLAKKGFSTANGLQCRVFSMLLPGSRSPDRGCGDICISAATGSGKTLAYALPLVESLKDKPVTRLRGLVVVPTRELVSQAHRILEVVAAGTNVKIGVAVGSNHLRDEQEKLVQKSQRWNLGTFQNLLNEEAKREDELMNWDLDFTNRYDELDCQPGQVMEYVSNVDILVCTPGRLIDHINATKGFHLHHIQWLIIDEADRLLDESFQEWIAKVIPQLEHVEPVTKTMHQVSQTFGLFHPRRVQKIILSATMTEDLSKLNSLHFFRPKMIVLEGMTQRQGFEGRRQRQHEVIELPESLFEVAMAVSETNYKPLYVVQLLQEFASSKTRRFEDIVRKIGEDVTMNEVIDEEKDNSPDSSSFSHSTSSPSPSSSSVASSSRSQNNLEQKKIATPGTLIFAKSNESALRLTRLLSILLPEHQIRALTKAPGNKEGRKTLSMFQKERVSVIIATDLASRGLDVPQLGFVINYDMPTSLISYVHRVGRTARAGREGKAVTLVEHKEGKWFWNEVARTDSVNRARKVTRMDGGLRSGPEERQQYELALQNLGREALRTTDGH